MTTGSVGIQYCPCCGAREFSERPVLWRGLITGWELSPEEATYIDRQQGLTCTACGSSLRSMTLAEAIMRAYGHQGYFNTFAHQHRRLRVLEINDAGQLGQFLTAMPHRVLVHYPDVDMTKLPFGEASFDFVIHSDTLEHVTDPLAGLRENHRVLRPGGFACFTVPLVVGRLTRSTEGRPPTYHGTEETQEYLVHTEFGADAWTAPIAAGFTEVRLVSMDFPTSVAIAAQK